jgi:hypothetical protein
VGRLVIVAALVLLALPANAPADALRDCIYDHELDRSYSLSELKQAIDEIPADHDEYGLCREILAGAMHAGPDRVEDAPASTSVPPEEQAQRDEDARELAAITGDAGGDPPGAGPERASPGPDRAADRDGRDTLDLASGGKLPTPVLLGLVALGLVTIAAAVATWRERPRSPSAMQ